jgi:20S proteasome alpha/beta subunit
MTTIAYRDGVLAADTMACSGHLRHGGVYTKIVQRADGTMGGGAGHAAFCESWKRWILDPSLEKPTPGPGSSPEDPGDMGLLVHPDGTVECCEHGGCYTLNEEYFAEGTGAPVAYGAFHKGATAEEAIRAAVAHDLCTGGPITVLRLP